MYTIGQFSIISNLPKKTLRYYDEIDLFKPALIDPYNQYRYYDKAQIEIISRIANLKKIGLSLEEIKKIILMEGNYSEIDIYKRRLGDIEKTIRELQIQKDSIVEIINNKGQKHNNVSFDFIIEESYLQEGSVIFIKDRLENFDYGKIIGAFYEMINSENIRIISSHMLKYDLDNNDEIEVFAYVNNDIKQKNIKCFERTRCFKLLCDGIHNRQLAYTKLFDYAKESGVTLGNSTEKYSMENGKMSIEIMVY